jgi:hypothetical protein
VKSGTTNEILFDYTPSYTGSAEAWIEFCLSEFDFKPRMIRLFASTRPVDILSPQAQDFKPTQKPKVDQPVLLKTKK